MGQDFRLDDDRLVGAEELAKLRGVRVGTVRRRGTGGILPAPSPCGL
jgi:hypothetical protein